MLDRHFLSGAVSVRCYLGNKALPTAEHPGEGRQAFLSSIPDLANMAVPIADLAFTKGLSQTAPFVEPSFFVT